ncbi:MOP flippase family protein [Paenibacillus sp. UNC499MF]|uniref:MOP flippase family protein n=1 Tax=Paenibacillus sp. UNC499MF TaxID=1502751 RepID=UPI00089F8E09|nr:MOP flippase family protein [Paenibacillus sp. UNC499MF]SEF80855.1 polysaccharide transporter, PST family [Paenibacillus sp. UNC499MF]
MSLRQQALNGGKWTAISTLTIVLLQMAQIAVISRFLDAKAFGLMGMILVIVGFAQSFTDMGISSAIIQRKETKRDELSSLYWLNIATGFTAGFVVWLTKEPIASFYKSPELADLLVWSSFLFPIIASGQQFQVLLQKELRFKVISQISIISMLAGTIISIGAAYSGMGVYALVLGQLSTSAVNSLLLIMLGWRKWKPQLHFHKNDLKGYLSFGMFQMGDRTVTYFNNNLDKIIIGRFLGAEALGYYSIAFNLIIIPLIRINPIVNRVAFPVFSKIQDNREQMKKGYMKVIRALSLVNLPLYFGLIVTAPLFIPIMFGAQWGPSILITQILCGVGILRSIANPVGSLVMATGKVRRGFLYNSFKTILQIPVIIIGAYAGGIIGVAVAFLSLKLFYFITNYLVMLKTLLGPCFLELLRSLKDPFYASIIMGIGVYVSSLVTTNYLSAGIALVLQIVTGIIVYASAILAYNPGLLHQLKGKLGNSRIKEGA